MQRVFLKSFLVINYSERRMADAFVGVFFFTTYHLRDGSYCSGISYFHEYTENNYIYHGYEIMN